MEHTYEELVMGEGQGEHLENIIQVLSKTYGFIDVSETGNGKTYVAMKLALELELPLFVLCPSIVVPNWTNLCAKYGVPMVACMSYGTFKSIPLCQPKHGYLTRYDKTEGTKVATFAPTQKLIDEIRAGTLFIFDEAHELKNDNTDIGEACHVITDLLVGEGGTSRFGLLSATLFDDAKQVPNVIRMLGYCHSKLSTYNRSTKTYDFSGIREFLEVCKTFDPQTTAELEKVGYGGDSYKDFLYDCFMDIVYPAVVNQMIYPFRPEDKDAANGYYRADPMTEKQIDKLIKDLVNITGYNTTNGTTDSKTFQRLKEIQLKMQEIENAKLPVFIRLVRETLDNNPRAKVVLSINYHQNLDIYLHAFQRDYGTLFINGKISAKDRQTNISYFNDDSDQWRILITNGKTGGVGISLHDIHGNRPRFLFISPNYSIQNCHQVEGRIVRLGMKSKATIRYVYINNVTKELNIIKALDKKTEVLNNLNREENKGKITYPGNYPEIAE